MKMPCTCQAREILARHSGPTGIRQDSEMNAATFALPMLPFADYFAVNAGCHVQTYFLQLLVCVDHTLSGVGLGH